MSEEELVQWYEPGTKMRKEEMLRTEGAINFGQDPMPHAMLSVSEEEACSEDLWFQEMSTRSMYFTDLHLWRKWMVRFTKWDST